MVENATYANYEKWLLENKTKVIEYVKQNDIAFRNIEISARAYNALRINGMHKFSDVALMSSEELSSLEMMDKTSVEEIRMFLRNYLRKHRNDITAYVLNTDECCFESSSLDTKSIDETGVEETSKETATQETIGNITHSFNWDDLSCVKFVLADEMLKERIIRIIEIKKIEIRDFDISVRTYNALRRNNVRYLHEALSYYPDGFDKISNFGIKAVNEICNLIENKDRMR